MRNESKIFEHLMYHFRRGHLVMQFQNFGVGKTVITALSSAA